MIPDKRLHIEVVIFFVPEIEFCGLDRHRAVDKHRNLRNTALIFEFTEQVDKLLDILPKCPSLKHINYDDPRSKRH